MKALAEYTQQGPDGESGMVGMIYSKYDDEGNRVTREQALEASGLEELNDDRMGRIQKHPPTISSTAFVWIFEQVWYANV